MGRYMINDGADRFTVRDDRDTVVATGLSLAAGASAQAAPTERVGQDPRLSRSS